MIPLSLYSRLIVYCEVYSFKERGDSEHPGI